MFSSVLYELKQRYILMNRKLTTSGRTIKIIKTYQFNCPHCGTRNNTFEAFSLWKVLNHKEKNKYLELVLSSPNRLNPSTTKRINDFHVANDVFVDTIKGKPQEHRKLFTCGYLKIEKGIAKQ